MTARDPYDFMSDEEREKEMTASHANAENLEAQMVVARQPIYELPEGPKSQSLADLQEYLSKYFEQMKAFLTEKGADASVNPAYFIFYKHSTYLASLPRDIDIDRPGFKRTHRKLICDFAKAHDAYAVALMGDFWIGSKDNKGTLPCDDPLHREALQVNVRVREGNLCWYRDCYYERRADEVVWQETTEGIIESTCQNGTFLRSDHESIARCASRDFAEAR